MSTYTYSTFGALIGVIGIGTTVLVRWIKREVLRIEGRIDHHDAFCDVTKDAITEIKMDIAGIKENMSSINVTLGDLAESNRDMIKFMLSKK